MNDHPPLNIIPLGGLGEIGLNMMVFEQGDDIIVVDCGLMFPGDSLPGVDYVIPDFSYLLDKRDRVRGVVLTHGHEDHIGALPYFLERVPAPVYATPLTLGLVREKLFEYDLGDRVPLERIAAGSTLRLGPFELEFIRVSHSIVDSLALAITTEIGTVIHTGDFKLDPTPVDGERADLAAFARYGDRGVLALLSDSTNVERTGHTRSEREVGLALHEVFGDAPGRLIVAMFASNIHRVQQVLNAAAHFGRKVVVLGRSMEANIRIARELGYLELPDGILADPSAIRRLPERELVILSTGSQGEPLSALSRLARDEHKSARIQPGDTVVLSSRVIPGNEVAIATLINAFYRRGAEVIYEKVSDIHASGHASQEELRLMIALTRPQYFIPIHGEYRHLVKHAQLALGMGVPRERVLVAENGDVISFGAVGGERRGVIETGKQIVHGACVADAEDQVLGERRKLGREGVLVAVAKVDRETGELIGPLQLSSRGLFYEEETSAILEEVSRMAEAEIRARAPKPINGEGGLEDALRVAVRRHLKKAVLRFPMIVPVIVEI
jgi:ribonuclease J